MQQVEIYTDGACSGNPGPGGWGAVLVSRGHDAEKEIRGGEPMTTNNRMELTAIVEALRLLRQPCAVEIVTDSQYVADAFRKNWIERWLRNGWKTQARKPVKNRELWEALLAAMEPHRIAWTWIRGHAGHPYNERADRLAVRSRDEAACGAVKGGGS